MIEDNIVIVLDLSNYKTIYKEKVPFKAKILDKTDNEIWVISLTTNKKYEIYSNQILEFLEIEQIKTLIDLSKY